MSNPNALDRLNALTARVEELCAEVRQLKQKTDAKPAPSSNGSAYPRRISDEAKAIVLRAYNEMVNELDIPIGAEKLNTRARQLPGGEAVPASIGSACINAIIAEHHGMHVFWSGKTPRLSLERTEDPRVLGRKRSAANRNAAY